MRERQLVLASPTEYLIRDALTIFALSTVGYVLLRSPIWIGDGIRYFPVVLGPRFPIDGGGNRHFLFPYQAWLVYHAVSALPFAGDPNDPTRAGAVAILQGWNALMAGAGLAILYVWLRCTVSRPAAFVGVAVTAFSNAFLLHATNMTEPMASVPPTLLGLLLVTRSPASHRCRLAAGVLIGIGSAFYALAAFSLIAAGVIVGLHRDESGKHRLNAKCILGTIEICAASAAVFASALAIPRLLGGSQGVVATVVGVTDPGLMGMYGRFDVRHLIGAFGGLTNAVCALPQMNGLSQLFHLRKVAIARTLGTFMLNAAFLVGTAWVLYRNRRNLLLNGAGQGAGRQVQAIAALAWFATIYVVAFYFLAGYDKIWFFAMFPLASLAALAFELCQEDHDWVRMALTVGPGLLLVLINVVFIAVPRRFARNEDLDAALRLQSLVQTNDLLVTPGWDAPSVYAGYALTRPLSCLRLTSEAIDTGFRPVEVADRFAAQARRARQEGGHIYFLGLLDLTPDQWEVFFGSQMHLPYALLDPYRRSAVPRTQIASTTGDVTLFEVAGNLP
jgi:hypothetical protein